MVRSTDRPVMTIAVDLGHKATKQTNKQAEWKKLSIYSVFITRHRLLSMIWLNIC